MRTNHVVVVFPVCIRSTGLIILFIQGLALRLLAFFALKYMNRQKQV